MRILIDVMSGDNAPLEQLRGVCQAAPLCGADFTLVGDETLLRRTAKAEGLDLTGFTLVHAPEVVSMEDDPVTVIRKKKDSSLVTGLKLLAGGEGDAFVSAGNTGALFAGATLLVKRAPGVQRAAIGTVMPGQKPWLLLDAGANVTVTEEYLEQFALLGSDYMRAMFAIDAPAVGLLNNGTEDCKGAPPQVGAYRRLAANEDLNFIGNVEASAVLFGGCDVVVTDGFTGNILLKALEGMGKYVTVALKDAFTAGTPEKLAALAMGKHLKQFKAQFDASEYGGSPILGITKPVIKAHGSSNARAFQNAIVQAVRCARQERAL